MSDAVLDQMRSLIQVDPGGRGLGTVPNDNLFTACPEGLAQACHSIAGAERPRIAVVTGFYIAHATPPCGETDGPLGAVWLARALVPLGIDVVLVTDPFCMPALEAGIASCGLRKSVPLVRLPPYNEATGMSMSEYVSHFQERAGRLTHLLTLERVGPSHTRESVGAAALADFVEQVPAEDHDRCHNIRGRDITANMSPAHWLFEHASCATIGIGDGGNELGMGKVPWDVIRRNVPHGARIACRIATEQLIVCGVSNWGAYALGAGVRHLRRAAHDAELFSPERELQLLEWMIERGPLVDGPSGRPEAIVDGLSFERYVEVLVRLGEMLAAESKA
jgi:hypothetical protein